MKPMIKIVILLMLFLLSCRERNSIFDPGNENFDTPPSLWYATISGVHYNNYGNIIGIDFEVCFTKEFDSKLILLHEIYRDNIVFTSTDKVVDPGTKLYTYSVFADYTIGSYCLEISFGGIPIGAVPFSIVPGGSFHKLIAE